MFSELVDAVKLQTSKLKRQSDIISYANSTIQESALLKTFYRDMTEEQLVTTAEPHIWTFPNNFRGIQAAKLPIDINNGRGEPIYFKSSVPGKRQRELDYFYYASMNYVVFSGASSGATIDLAWYGYPWPLQYYEVGSRPAVYDPEAEIKGTEPWTYLPEYDDSDANREIARNLVSNWLLLRWNNLVLEGTKAKLFRTQSEDNFKSTSTYSEYKDMQKKLMLVERSVNLIEQADYAAG